MKGLNMQSRTRQSLQRALFGGGTVACLLAFGVGGWAVTTELSGAVIAPGLLVVDNNVKKVQHPTGGVIGELRVSDGTEVKAGDLLLRLDETVTRANLAMIIKNMDELIARQARLKAEQDGSERVSFPEELIQRKAAPDIGRLMGEETRLFELRREARSGQKAQLSERIAQLREQIVGMQDQIAAKEREIALVNDELKGVRELWQKNLVQLTRLTALEREAARLGGEKGVLISSIAQTRGKITETELQVLQIDQDLRTEVGKELADIRGKLAESVEKRITAEDQLKRIDVRSPQDGVVDQLAVHTIGGVITASEPLMVIVPRAEKLIVEAKIQPQDIDQIHAGNAAVLRFSAFNLRTTPEIGGKVIFVSADVSKDEKTNASFYTVRILPSAQQLAQLDNLKLVPGMPVESFIKTGERTVISCLTKPLQDQLSKAWREKF